MYIIVQLFENYDMKPSTIAIFLKEIYPKSIRESSAESCVVSTQHFWMDLHIVCYENPAKIPIQILAWVPMEIPTIPNPYENLVWISMFIFTIISCGNLHHVKIYTRILNKLGIRKINRNYHIIHKNNIKSICIFINFSEAQNLCTIPNLAVY